MKTISDKKIQNSCNSCGNCYSICPQDAIKIEFNNTLGYVNPVLDKNNCIECGLCLTVCPVINQSDTGSYNNFLEQLTGKYKLAFCGYARDGDIRFKASSGGLLTLMLIHLLLEDKADEALIVSFDENDPLKVKSEWTNNISEVLRATGSKYQVVSNNSLLKKVLQEEKRYIFVGLPCHLNSLAIFAEKNKKIKNRIVYKFSLCCSHNMSSNVMDLVLHKHKLNKNDVKSIKYRGNGWPNYLRILMKDGTEHKFDKKHWNYLFLSFFYTPRFCLNCQDVLGETADISFADAWLEKYVQTDAVGTSLCLIRSEKAQLLYDELLNRNLIEAEEIAPIDVVRAQKIGLFYKKAFNNLKKTKLSSKLYELILKFNSKISNIKFFKYTPMITIKYYYILLQLLFFRRQIKLFEEEIDENINS